jgi:hypothetical protein
MANELNFGLIKEGPEKTTEAARLIRPTTTRCHFQRTIALKISTELRNGFIILKRS